MFKIGNLICTIGGKCVLPPVDYNPLGLPPYTIRARFRSGITPTMGDSQTLIDATNNIWDICKVSSSWEYLFYKHPEGTGLIEVLGANATGVTDMDYLFANCQELESVALFDTTAVQSMHSMFEWCTILTTVPLFDTSSVTDMAQMFSNCWALIMLPVFNTHNVTNFGDFCWTCMNLTAIPLFDTSSATQAGNMFANCTKVKTGALALYTQMAAQSSPPTHNLTFYRCGYDTVTGAAELAQIPASWK